MWVVGAEEACEWWRGAGSAVVGGETYSREVQVRKAGDSVPSKVDGVELNVGQLMQHVYC